MSSFCIVNMASVIRSIRGPSPEAMYSLRSRGTSCQVSPNRSVTQPHIIGSPPSQKASQSRSISAWVAQSTMNEMAGVKTNSGPALRAMNSRPCNSKTMVITSPAGRPASAAVASG